MWDALIELIHSLFTQGISWGALLAFLIFLSKVQRADKYKLWNRDVVQNQRVIMRELGVDKEWSGHVETLWNEEARSLKKSLVSFYREIHPENQRRKKKMSALSNLNSKKLLAFILLVLINGLNQTLGLNWDTDTIQNITQGGSIYIVAQAVVDVVKAFMIKYQAKGAATNGTDLSTSDKVGQ